MQIITKKNSKNIRLKAKLANVMLKELITYCALNKLLELSAQKPNLNFSFLADHVRLHYIAKCFII